MIKYLEEILGEAPDIVSLEKKRIQGLPQFLAKAYQFLGCTLFGCSLVIAKPIAEDDLVTPGEFTRHVIRLQEHFRMPVVLVLARVEAYQRNRLVQKGVPFIVPGRQLFLPQLMVDLSERYPRTASKRASLLSVPAQFVILYHLLVEVVGGFCLGELARRTGYSAMTLSKVQDELGACGLCLTEQIGRRKYLRFNHEGRELWKEALVFLRSPVRSKQYVRQIAPQLLVMESGISALSEYTNINSDPIPTYAIKDSVFKKAIINGEATVAQDKDEAMALVELWAYNPAFANDKLVDELSLFLSMKDDPDERVQKELKRIMDKHPW